MRASCLFAISLVPLVVSSLAPAQQPTRPASGRHITPGTNPTVSSETATATPMKQPAGAADIPSLTGSDPLLEPVSPPNKFVTGWRDALAAVRTHSADLRIALANLAQAEAQTRIALASALPTLNLTANVTDPLIRTVPSPTGLPATQVFPSKALSYGGNVQLNVPLFAPSAWHSIATAERSEDVAKLGISNQKRLTAAAVASALVGVITAERVSELNKVGLRNALERLQLTKRRAELGAATALDVIRIDQDTATARSAVVSGDESLRQARESLGLALGFSEAYGVPKDIRLNEFVHDSEQACQRVGSITDRPDVAAAHEQTRAAQSGVRDVEMSFSPTVNLVSTFGLNRGPALPYALPTGEVPYYTNESWTIAGVLQWTIFDGGVRYGNLRNARAQVEQAAAKADSTQRSASIEVTQAIRNVHVSEQARVVAEQARDLARETERLSRLNFELGKGTSLDLVDSGRRLREGDITLALREFDTVQAKIRALLTLSLCEY